jgi:hypothetical protein
MNKMVNQFGSFLGKIALLLMFSAGTTIAQVESENMKGPQINLENPESRTLEHNGKKIIIPSSIKDQTVKSYPGYRIGYSILNEPKDFIGRWNLTLDMNGKETPSWLEVKQSGLGVLVGYFVGDHGSARPISVINFENDKISFSIPPQWESGNKDLVFEGVLLGDKLTGTIQYPNGGLFKYVGEKAPSLARDQNPIWGKPINIFNGKNLDGWHADKSENQWVVKDGILSSPKTGANLITNEKFEDFKLLVEFRYPKGSNSGLYLRGRYELQIQDDIGKEPSDILFGGIYGFLTPNEMAAKSAGEWQTYEITLIGRRLTVVANGKKIINDQIIPGITGGALDSKEGLPGPIVLQGDHGPAEFRKIVITPGR